MTKITVGGTATLLAAEDANRGSLTVQHIGVDHSGVAVWVGESDVAAGNGFLLNGLPWSIHIESAAARQAWYGVASESVDVMVITSSQWDSRAG